jgi:hypothetical protein
MFKTVIQLLLFASLVLAIGQIPLGRSTVGENYIWGLKRAGNWSVEKLKDSKWLAGFEIPKSFDSWIKLRNPKSEE